MKKGIKVLVCLACLMCLVAPFAACSENVVWVDKHVPVEDIIIDYQTVAGDIAGFKLPHNSGLADEDYEYDYDSSLFYRNEARTTGADPGAIYTSIDDIRDSYQKYRDCYKYTNENGERDWIAGWSDERFNAEMGTEEEWIAQYGNMYYVAVTQEGGLTSADAAKYHANKGAFRMFSSTDFVNWKVSGVVSGFTIPVNTSTDWCDKYFWAPEFIRDPVSGMYFMFWGAVHKNGGPGHTYPTQYTGHDTANERGSIAMSYNPQGPYELVTTQDYITLRAGKDKDGNLLTGDTLITDPMTGEKYFEVYGQDGETVIGYKNGNGYFNLGGMSYTRDTPILNAGYYYTRFCTSESKKNELREISRPLFIGEEENYVTETLDLNPVIDAKGDLYLYFTMSTVGGTHGASGVYGIWVVRMLDFITPDWDSLRYISRVGYTYITNDGSTLLGEYGPVSTFNEGGVNEGCNILYHDGRYYMTYSYFGYTDVRYSVGISIADNPYGPFVKQYQYMPLLGKGTEFNDYKGGTGHHCFVQAGDELFILYHATDNPSNNYDRSNNYLGRHLAIDRVFWKEVEDLGYDMLFCNGATTNLQPKPETFTGYENVAKYATIEGNGDIGKTEYLNDGMFTAQPFSRIFEYGKSDGDLRITFTWNEPVAINTIMIYNSGSIYDAFNKVNSIRFKLAEKPKWYSSDKYNGYCYIENLEVDSRDVNVRNKIVHHGAAAIASFDKITVTEMSFVISGEKDDKYMEESPDFSVVEGYKQVCVADVFVFGNKA